MTQHDAADCIARALDADGQLAHALNGSDRHVAAATAIIETHLNTLYALLTYWQSRAASLSSELVALGLDQLQAGAGHER